MTWVRKPLQDILDDYVDRVLAGSKGSSIANDAAALNDALVELKCSHGTDAFQGFQQLQAALSERLASQPRPYVLRNLEPVPCQS